VIVAALLGQEHFEESGFITFLSFLQLVFISILAWFVFKTRRGTSESIDWKAPYVLWIIISIGFMFLAADELCGIHETADILIHKILGMQETDLSDRLDDAIVAFYVVIALAFLYVYRTELKHYRAAFPLLGVGFCLMLVSIAVDAFTNRQDYTTRCWRSLPVEFYSSYPPEFPIILRSWLMVIEDALKVIGEGVFIGFFHHCLIIAERFSKERRPGE
jgi:hypothetical protein